MTRTEIKDQLDALLDTLPADKAELLLGFATLLKQHSRVEAKPAAPEDGLDDWDRAIIAAEEYWFSLPEDVRKSYGNKTVAVMKERILDADDDPDALAARVEAQCLDWPVLYVEADAERLAPLILHTPRFR